MIAAFPSTTPTAAREKNKQKSKSKLDSETNEPNYLLSYHCPLKMVLPGMSGAADGRQMCKYGEECYQKNPMHIEKFRHPCDKDSVKEQEKTAGVVEQNGAKRKLSEEEGERVDAGAGGKKGEPNKKAAKVDEKENEKPEDKGGDDEDEEEDEETEDLLPPSPLDPKENIRQKLLVDMPEDFFAFWKFCKERNPSSPADALSPAGLLLVGAFDILSGKLKDSNNRIPSDYLCHYRSGVSHKGGFITIF